jgi:hypothetical protein
MFRKERPQNEKQRIISERINAGLISTCFKECITELDAPEISAREEQCLTNCALGFARMMQSTNDFKK